MELRRRIRAALTALLAVALVLAVLWWLARPTEDGPTPATTVDGHRLAAACTVTHPFKPVQAYITGRAVPVLALPRDAAGVPSTPPLTETGKTEMAWDRSPTVRPGSRHGNVLLNTHTWPDGSALGNRLLDRLHQGDGFELRGPRGQRLCYRVTRRVQVLAADGYPRYYQDIGRPQVAIIVCSGRRLGPDNWTHRTIWFASPRT